MTFKRNSLRINALESSFICINHQLTREQTVLPNINGQVKIQRWKDIKSKVQRVSKTKNLWANKKEVDGMGRLKTAS